MTGGTADPLDPDAGGPAQPVAPPPHPERPPPARRRPVAVPLVLTLLLGVTLAGTARLVRRDAPPGAAGSSASPASPAGPVSVLAVTYQGVVGPGRAERTYRLDLASDGSFHWAADDGSADVTFDAPTSRAVEVLAGGDMPAGGDGPTGEAAAFVATGVPPGGPDRRIPVPPPLGPLAEAVIALGRAGDARVAPAVLLDRPVWRYDGPIRAERPGRGSPDHARVEVDQQTGAALASTLTAGGRPYSSLVATSATLIERGERSRFAREPRPGTETALIPHGFATLPLEEAAREHPVPLLLPSEVPPGFTLTTVAVNREAGRVIGGERDNPSAAPVVAMEWRNGFLAFSLTLRPQGRGRWSDPYVPVGTTLDARALRLDLAGRPPLAGQLVLDPPVRPHLWGISGDLVVTVDGDLSTEELSRVAGSLRAR